MSSQEVRLFASHPTTSASLTPRERARLANILARLASPFESERAAAGLLATAFMDKHRLTWSELTGVTEAAPNGAPSSAKNDRRRGLSRLWHGYCRRRAAPVGHALSRFA